MHERAREKRKAMIAIAMTVFVFVAFVCAFSVAPQEEKSFASSFEYDATNLFCVRSDEDFKEIVALSQKNEKTFSGKTVALYTDVNAPSGELFKEFEGTFNGNGFAIKNLTGTMFSGRFIGKASSFYLSDVDVKTGAVLADGVHSKATISDVDIYGKTQGYVVSANNGTLTDVASCLAITGEGGFVSLNKGKIENCFLSGTIAASSEEVQPLVSITNGGEIKNSMAVLTINSDVVCTVYPFGNALSGVAENCGAILSVGENVTIDYKNAVADESETPERWIKKSFVKTSSSVVVYDESGSSGTEYSALGDGFYVKDGGVPIVKTLFGAEGTETDPFLIENMHDVKRLVFAITEDTTKDGFYAKLTRDVFGTNFSSGTDSPSMGSVRLTIDVNGHIFAKTSFAPFSNASLTNSAAVTVEEGFGGDGYKESTFTGVTSSTTISGSGTESDPYSVRDAADLAALLSDTEKNIAGKKAIVLSDIILNNTLSSGKVLAETAPDVKLDIDFLGHSFVNVFLAPFGAVSGSIKNLTLVLSDKENLPYAVCSSVANAGSLERVNVSSLSNNKFTSGFTKTNDGSITFCNSFVASDNAFCETNGGSIVNCAASSGEFCSGTVKFCTANGKRANGSGTVGDGSGYFDLKNDGFDVNVFGYEVGKDETKPEIRRKGVSYRVADFFTKSDGISEEYTPGGRKKSTFAETEGFLVNEGAEGVTVEYSWTYEGNEYTADYLTDVGEYVLHVKAYGDGVITTEADITYMITKAECAIDFEEGTKTLSVDYRGEEIRIDDIAPQDYAELQSNKGYEISYSIATVKDCGRYTQTITLDSKNYQTKTFTRTIDVNKIRLSSVKVGNTQIKYGEEVDFSSFDGDMLTFEGTVGEDTGKTSKEIIKESESGFVYSDLFSAEYEEGNDVGDYTIDCSYATLNKYLKNYTVDKDYVVNGVLTVNKATIPDDKIMFSGNSFVYDGTEKSIRIDDVEGNGVPSGATVKYDNNGQKDVGNYTVTATVAHKNYEDKTVSATLSITKAEIVLTVSSAEKEYGYEFDSGDFTFTYSGTVGGEDFSKVTEGITFTACLKNEVETLVVDEYEVCLDISGKTQNYYFTVKSGTLTINKVYLTNVYASAKYGDISEEYTGNEIDYALPTDAFGGIAVNATYKITSGRNETDKIIAVGEYTVEATVAPMGEDANNYLTTTYSRTVTVVRIKTTITFGKTTYEFVYDGENKANAEYYAYMTEKMPENPQINVRFKQNGKEINEISHVGEYIVEAEFTGDGNFGYARATATVAIKARSTTLTVRPDYVYYGNSIIPAITTISYADGFDGKLAESDVSYVFTDAQGGTYGAVAEAATYTVVATSKNPDYKITSGSFEIVVAPREVEIGVEDISFQYGAYGLYTSNAGMLNIGSGEITLTEFEINEKGRTEAITFRPKRSNDGKYFGIGTYTITTEELVQPRNYVFSLIEAFTLTVDKRTLEVSWFFDGNKLGTREIALTYAGRDQAQRITYDLSGFVSEESEQTVTVTKTISQGINKAELVHVGEYTVALSVTNAPNYVFDDAAKIKVKVGKSPLNGITVEVPGGEVRQYENMPSPTFAIDGLKGSDEGVSPYMLKGFSFTQSTDYNRLTAKEGDTYYVSGSFTFADYSIDSGRITKARVKVVKGYRSYTMSDASFVYDGTEKKIELTDVEEGVEIKYDGNGKKDVGRYTVNATVVYPTGRTEVISATMTITKATPIVTTTDEYTVFTETRDLTSDDVNATVTLNDVIPVVSGTITFIGSGALQRGAHTYSLLFKPTDSKNLTEVRFTKKITAYNVTGASLTFSHSDFVANDKNELTTEKVLEVYIDKTPFVGAENDIELYQNGSSVARAVFNRTAKEKLEIRYRAKTVFEITYDVKFGQKEEETAPSVKVDVNMLSVAGLSFASDESKIYLAGAAGVISMKEEYKDAYDLYIDGVLIEDGFTLRKGVSSVTMEIKNKKLNVTQFSKTIVVTTEADPDIVVEPTDDDKKGFKTYYYYIIAAGGALLLAGIVLVVVKLRR